MYAPLLNRHGPQHPGASPDAQRRKVDAILSFRTISTLISILSRSGLGLGSNDPDINEDTELMTSILWREPLDAFATLLVRDNERAAVTSTGLKLEDGSYKSHIIACVEVDRQYGDLEDTFENSILSHEWHGSEVFNMIGQWHSGSVIDHAASILKLINRWKVQGHNPLTDILAMCARNIHRRMSHPKLSKPFSDNLLNAPKPSTISGPFPKPVPRSQRQVHRDRAFLEMVPIWEVQFPQLPRCKHLKRLAYASGEKSIYTYDTADEFHDFLCYMIGEYYSSLERFIQFMDGGMESLPRGQPFHDIFPELESMRRRVSQTAMILRTAADSSAFRPHLARMEPYLVFKDLKDKELDRYGEHIWTDEDVALRDVYPEDDDSVSEAYMNWLNLHLAHLDGLYYIDILLEQLTHLESDLKHSGKVEKPPKKADNVHKGADLGPFSVEVFVIPPQDAYMYTWRDVMTTLFPTKTGDKRYGRLTAENAVAMIEELVSNGELEDLKPASPLSTGVGFRGTLHCEAFLASLMRAPDETMPEEIRDLFEPMGTSEPCCEVCSKLMELLGPDPVLQVRPRASHNKVYPLEILEKMVSHFGEELKNILWQQFSKGKLAQNPVVLLKNVAGKRRSRAYQRS
ncbi:hypothetical protein BDQ17DRAFT_1368306 [Cyathus striatus]|nr:hypothetical protein BDQ17DRAFT_1368306 [Cyathus striatus]